MIRYWLYAAAGLLAALPLGRAGATSQTLLYSFKGGTDGALPFAGLLADAGGQSLWNRDPGRQFRRQGAIVALYGTTFNGGTDNFGAAYKYVP